MVYIEKEEERRGGIKALLPLAYTGDEGTRGFPLLFPPILRGVFLGGKVYSINPCVIKKIMSFFMAMKCFPLYVLE